MGILQNIFGTKASADPAGGIERQSVRANVTATELMQARSAYGDDPTFNLYQPAFADRDDAISLSALNAAVRLLSGTFAYMLCNGYYNVKDKYGNIIVPGSTADLGGRVEALLDLLVYSSDAGLHSSSQIIEDCFVDYLIESNGLLKAEMDGRGRVTALKRLRSWTARVEKRTNKAMYYRAQEWNWWNNAYEVIPHHNVVHARLPHLQRVYGSRGYRHDFAVPAVRVLRPALGCGLALDKYVFRQADAANIQNLFVSFKEASQSDLTDTQLEDLYKEVAEQQKARRGYFMFADASATDITPKMQKEMAELRQYQVRDVARFYGIPVSMLSEDGPSVGSNTAEIVRVFKTFTMTQWSQRFLDALTLRVLNPGHHAELDWTHLMAQDPVQLKALMDVYRGDGQRPGLATEAEARKAANLSPKFDGELMNQFPAATMANKNLPTDSDAEGSMDEGEDENSGDAGGSQTEPSM